MLAKSGTVSLLVQVMQGRTETDIAELFEAFQFQPEMPLLDKLVTLKDKLSELNLALHPGFDDGDLSSPRCIAFESKTLSSAAAKVEFGDLESERLELKSSLVFDYRKQKENKNLSPAECRSDSVIQSTLKTVAAFLNSRGGVLYVGVDDSGAILGLEADYASLKSKKAEGNDAWQLTFRDLIQGRFKDGDSIGNYTDVKFIDFDGKCVARIEVASRRKLSFLKGKDGWQLYRRDGNRTIEVPIDQVEEFIFNRPLQDSRFSRPL